MYFLRNKEFFLIIIINIPLDFSSLSHLKRNCKQKLCSLLLQLRRSALGSGTDSRAGYLTKIVPQNARPETNVLQDKLLDTKVIFSTTFLFTDFQTFVEVFGHLYFVDII